MTLRLACDTIAKSLREFGYPDVTAAMAEEIVRAWLGGKRGEELPHGVIGRFAEAQIEEVEAERPGTFAELEKSDTRAK